MDMEVGGIGRTVRTADIEERTIRAVMVGRYGHESRTISLEKEGQCGQ